MRRAFDLIFALVISPIILVLILLCSIAIAVCEGRPIFYSSKRVGKNQHVFTIIKLRTMSSCAPLIPSNDETASLYVTKLGQFLRFSSLDELPQIFNILNGSMTFIGPRPCLASEVRLIEHRKRKNIFSMTPGLTGLAQVRGRDKNSMRNKVRYELFYLKKKSLLFNMYIILITLRSVWKFSDVNH
tara:strand:+ start:97 stop:654 length:558 start_codon:yes stop_codon:yes gene_type:complete